MKVSFLKEENIDLGFYPFTYIRNVEDILSGVFSNKERWERIVKKHFGENISFTDQDSSDIILDPCVVPTSKLVNLVLKGDANITWNNKKIVTRKGCKAEEVFQESLYYIYDKLSLVNLLKVLIVCDQKLFLPKSNITTIAKDSQTIVYEEESCYVGEGVDIRNTTLNARKGPIVIGDNVEIMEYSVIHGPVVIQSGSKVAPNSFIRSGAVVGKNSYVSGEMKNTLFMSNSNKGHFGYLGDAIVGEFCNLGAGTSNSNLKNNFSGISFFNPHTRKVEETKLEKLGSFIGDFTMTAVNTVLSGGSTIGIMSNVYGQTHYPKYIPSFSWGIDDVYKQNDYRKTAEKLLLHKGFSASEIVDFIDKLDNYYNKLINQ